MPKIAVHNSKGEQVGEMELSPAIFAAPVNEAAVHEVVVAYLANQRRGTASTKTRGMVRGGGRKPWRQKGTGRARHGSRRSPLWVGGGIVFGPTPRKYGYRIPRKVRRLALLSALSARAQENAVYVIDSLELDKPSTKAMVQLFKAIGADKPLVVTASADDTVERSTRNIPDALALTVEGLNVYDIVRHTALVISRDAVAAVEEALA